MTDAMVATIPFPRGRVGPQTYFNVSLGEGDDLDAVLREAVSRLDALRRELKQVDTERLQFTIDIGVFDEPGSAGARSVSLPRAFVALLSDLPFSVAVGFYEAE